jgi:hypothetical protein
MSGNLFGDVLCAILLVETGLRPVSTTIIEIINLQP